SSSHSYGLVSILYLTFFFFNDTATTEIYTLSLHDALPISTGSELSRVHSCRRNWCLVRQQPNDVYRGSLSSGYRNSVHACSCIRSEEHTSELQSRRDLVCRLLLEKKKKKKIKP